MDRFKGLDVIDRVPEDLWTELHNTVQEAVTKTIPKKKKCKKESGCLRRLYKDLRREAEGRGEEEIYTQVNAEFQRIASGQSKEGEENNEMEKAGNHFKKSGDIKGTFHVRTGTIRDRNGKYLKEAEEIKKRWQEYIKREENKSLWSDKKKKTNYRLHLDLR